MRLKTEKPNPTDPRTDHARAVKIAAGQSAHIALISSYARSGRLSAAGAIFREIVSPCVVSWTALICAHSNSAVSLSHFVSMLRHRGIRPNERTFASLFKTCASLCLLRVGLQLHSLSLKLCLSSLRYCGSALMSFYSKCGSPHDAREVFDEMLVKDDVCYAAMIVGLAQNSCLVEALEVFAKMRLVGVCSTESSVSGALSAAAELAAGLTHCRVIHTHAMVTGLDHSEVVGTALIDGYGKCGMVSEAKMVFNELVPVTSLVGWNAMMACYARQGDSDSVVECFDRLMICGGFDPDEHTFLAVLTCFCNAGLAREAERWMGRMMEDYGLEPWIEHYTCLIGALAKAGKLKEAERMSMSMPFEPDAGVWRTLLVASSHHGDADLAWRMSQRLLRIDPCDDSAYVIAANTFWRCGRWIEAIRIKKMMEADMVRKEDGISWIEM